jgi:hypothetical protein
MEKRKIDLFMVVDISLKSPRSIPSHERHYWDDDGKCKKTYRKCFGW